MNRVILIVCVLIYFCSCDKHPDWLNEFLSQEYHQIELDFNRNQSMGLFKRYLDSLSCSIAFSVKEENDLPFIYFNPKSKQITKKENGSYKLGLYLYPCQYGEFDILYRNKLEIRMDSNREIAVENINVRLDSLPYFVKTHILNFGQDPNYSTKPQGALIEISLDNKLEVRDMEPILDKVVEGYQNSLLLYLDQSKIKDLRVEEIEKVRDEIPFNIWIESQQLKLPPPKEPRIDNQK